MKRFTRSLDRTRDIDSDKHKSSQTIIKPFSSSLDQKEFIVKDINHNNVITMEANTGNIECKELDITDLFTTDRDNNKVIISQDIDVTGTLTVSGGVTADFTSTSDNLIQFNDNGGGTSNDIGFYGPRTSSTDGIAMFYDTSATRFKFLDSVDLSSQPVATINLTGSSLGDLEINNLFCTDITGSGTLTGTTLAGTLSTASQPNVTSVGTLTGLTMGGTINIQDGTFANPSLAFNNDPDTGIYLASSNRIGITASGALVAAFSTLESRIYFDMQVDGRTTFDDDVTVNADVNPDSLFNGAVTFDTTSGQGLLEVDSASSVSALDLYINGSRKSSFSRSAFTNGDLSIKNFDTGAITFTPDAQTGSPVLSINSSQVEINTGLEGPDGSTSTPTYSFSGDTNTGMYRFGADAIAFSCGNENRFIIEDERAILLTGLNSTTPSSLQFLEGGTTGNIAGFEIQYDADNNETSFGHYQNSSSFSPFMSVPRNNSEITFNDSVVIERTSAIKQSASDGVANFVLRLQNDSAPSAGLSLVSFCFDDDTTNQKMAIGAERTGSSGRGDLIFLNSGAGGTGNCSLSDERMRIGTSETTFSTNVDVNGYITQTNIWASYESYFRTVNGSLSANTWMIVTVTGTGGVNSIPFDTSTANGISFNSGTGAFNPSVTGNYIVEVNVSGFATNVNGATIGFLQLYNDTDSSSEWEVRSYIGADDINYSLLMHTIRPLDSSKDYVFRMKFNQNYDASFNDCSCKIFLRKV